MTTLALTFLGDKVKAQAVPTITTTGGLSSLGTVYGTPSTAQVFNVFGSNMTAGILVTPPNGFEVSIDNSIFYDNYTIPPGAAGNIPSTAVYVRLKSTLAAGSYSRNVILTSTGATTVNVAIVNNIVTRAILKITAVDVAKNYGETIVGAAGATAFLASGLKNAETIGSVTIYYSAGASAVASAGTYAGSVVPSAAIGGTFTASNYSITYQFGTITINKIPLTIIADDKSKLSGTVNPVLTATYLGFVNNDNATQLTTPPLIATTVIATSPVGQYPITASGAASVNYTFNYIDGILTVIPSAINIPNTFTPNNDGINDTWEIQYLSFYTNCTIEVLNRYGEQVYFARGYPAAWDGKYKGAELPVGTYYYIINLNYGGKPLSGAITILR